MLWCWRRPLRTPPLSTPHPPSMSSQKLRAMDCVSDCSDTHISEESQRDGPDWLWGREETNVRHHNTPTHSQKVYTCKRTHCTNTRLHTHHITELSVSLSHKVISLQILIPSEHLSLSSMCVHLPWMCIVTLYDVWTHSHLHLPVYLTKFIWQSLFIWYIDCPSISLFICLYGRKCVCMHSISIANLSTYCILYSIAILSPCLCVFS